VGTLFILHIIMEIFTFYIVIFLFWNSKIFHVILHRHNNNICLYVTSYTFKLCFLLKYFNYSTFSIILTSVEVVTKVTMNILGHHILWLPCDTWYKHFILLSIILYVNVAYFECMYLPTNLGGSRFFEMFFSFPFVDLSI